MVCHTDEGRVLLAREAAVCPLTPTLVPKIVIKLQVLVPDYRGAPCSCQLGYQVRVRVVAILGCQLYLLHLELTGAVGCMCERISLFGSFRMRRHTLNLDYLKLEDTSQIQICGGEKINRKSGHTF